ncbi:hypothetical protein [Cupriavidus sp. H39]|uniref:hypothetical protein n=1 Tax=Cupriavidus sp. H39 TaxID=3401635 RepID=UPI003CFD76EB
MTPQARLPEPALFRLSAFCHARRIRQRHPSHFPVRYLPLQAHRMLLARTRGLTRPVSIITIW